MEARKSKTADHSMGTDAPEAAVGVAVVSSNGLASVVALAAIVVGLAVVVLVAAAVVVLTVVVLVAAAVVVLVELAAVVVLVVPSSNMPHSPPN